ncbi:hypothetical protein TWF718_009928 [Orbilia javanica]|uniref:Uncharacterized protein n=1 Tax=Orbilia javanica TaxID=47235 RepID=A0AAN8MKW7_9PEZI
MCVVNEYVSRTGCGHNVSVFSRCEKAIKESQVQCHFTLMAKTSCLDNKSCKYCEVKKNAASPDPKPKRKQKPNKAKVLFDKLLNIERPSRHSRSESSRWASGLRSSPPRLRQRTLASSERWKQGQGIRKKRSKPRKADRIDFDEACIDSKTTVLDYGETKENAQSK